MKIYKRRPTAWILHKQTGSMIEQTGNMESFIFRLSAWIAIQVNPGGMDSYSVRLAAWIATQIDWQHG
jgi:hypothetical protein